MRIDLSGAWNIELENGETGSILLPGILQAQGFGELVTEQTEWISGLHDSLWHQRADYQFAQEEQCNVPFLSQPPRHYIGRAWYEKDITIEREDEWTLYMELTHWESSLWLDGVFMGTDCSLCTAHEIPIGFVKPGIHRLRICIDNRMKYPYRPDGHGVSDALGATWNGIVGEFILLSSMERENRRQQKEEYAKSHKRTIEVQDGLFYVDGKPEYFRGTHFGGEYPITGYPQTKADWWDKIMQITKDWGLNFIRCHSYCPPEAAFLAADKAGVYLQPECGMWNIFNEDIEMLEVLKEETERILRQFGHHPSFVLFSPSNEPGGEWYKPLRNWVRETKAYDETLGYQKRRLYTAQSGWFYDVVPKETEGTDYLYFHRSAYGPIMGGNIRNYEGWKGKDYLPSLEGTKIPVICHELGQWCSYPDFAVSEKFKGYLKPGNYRVFEENAKARGVYSQNRNFVFHSGRNQIRMYKEELEANFRTPHMYGFELLDLHDYLGQGTALVGVLDAFWEEKGYVKPEEWRTFCDETVILARIFSYTYKNTDCAVIPVEICHFGAKEIEPCTLQWRLMEEEACVLSGEWKTKKIPLGKNYKLGEILLDFSIIEKNSRLRFEITLGEIHNDWELFVYGATIVVPKQEQVMVTKDWSRARKELECGGRVVFFPYLSSLNYDCPPLSMRSVFWNAQMGPGWSRSLGMIVKEEHPLFAYFPTEKTGGWQWEAILSRARGFNAKDILKDEDIIVQPIDDWNRNLKQALIFECKAGDGKLLLASADLDGSFEERPEAFSLKQALIAYAGSKNFTPEHQIDINVLQSQFTSNHIMRELGAKAGFGTGITIEKPENLLDGNPNTSAVMTAEQYPMELKLTLSRCVKSSGFYCMTNQKDRMHEGDVKAYRVLAFVEQKWSCVAEGELLSTERQQVILFEKPVISNSFRLFILSGYQQKEAVVWGEERDGWKREKRKTHPQAAFSVLNLITEEMIQEDNEVYWDKSVRSTTKEIDD